MNALSRPIVNPSTRNRKFEITMLDEHGNQMKIHAIGIEGSTTSYRVEKDYDGWAAVSVRQI